jgi:hypothetical protein
MNVRQLKEQLAGVPDDAIVVVPAPDHSYRPASVDSMKARSYHDRRTFYLQEDTGQETGVRVSILVFS